MKLGFKVIKLPWYVTSLEGERIRDVYYSIFFANYYAAMPALGLPEQESGRTEYKIGQWTQRKPGWGPLAYFPKYADAERYLLPTTGTAIMLAEILPIPPQLQFEEDIEPTPFWTPRNQMLPYFDVPTGTGYAAGIRPIALIELPWFKRTVDSQKTGLQHAWNQAVAPKMTREQMIAACKARPKQERPTDFVHCMPASLIEKLTGLVKPLKASEDTSGKTATTVSGDTVGEES